MKNIIFCADGTWNGPTGNDVISDPSNVQLYFETLVNSGQCDHTKSEQESKVWDESGNLVQIAKYINGVGAENSIFEKAFGGALGFGLMYRIARGYTFISRNYKSGDKIFMLGFSRGAYTSRALAGLISKYGLLDWEKLELEESSNTSYLAAMTIILRYFSEGKENEKFSSFTSKFFDICADQSVKFGKWLTHLIMPEQRLIPVEAIECVSVWDTVGAYGIPFYDNLERKYVDFFEFADKVLNPKIKRGLHAISIDERRLLFTPTLWEKDKRITQVLYTGSHSDVGGGYTERGLSDISLEWIINETKKLGVMFEKDVPNLTLNALSAIHPQWERDPWPNFKSGDRDFLGRTDLLVAASVIDRINNDKGYQPLSLKNLFGTFNIPSISIFK
ncbi:MULTISPECIES: DUF2235 domain-containing protein [Acinetobacter]|uniref:DUF2235 domain-containing protein n=1 Tax=Acinetobacter TaxID=469 RepID=UPI00069B4B3C|nr:DUF2235 domain-containing protein [Acinetobacter sp. AG1]